MVIGRGHEPPVWRIAERLFNAISELAIRLGGVDDDGRVCTALTMHRIIFMLGER
jgi:hypothetical protein